MNREELGPALRRPVPPGRYANHGVERAGHDPEREVDRRVSSSFSEERALETARRILEASGYGCPDLQTEALEHGWKVFEGEDVGAVRVTFNDDAMYSIEFETLKMWWQGRGPSFLSRLVAGTPEHRPGGHLLWTPVLKVRHESELKSVLEYAVEMREAMLDKARRRWLQPVTCRLLQLAGNRISGYGETRDGLRWSAEGRNRKVTVLDDSAPLWNRLLRPFRPKPKD